MRLVLFAFLILAVSALPARAQGASADEPGYRFCQVGDAYPMVRTLKGDGGFAFQSLQNGTIRGRGIALERSLVWVTSPTAEPDLILVQDLWAASEYDFEGSRAIASSVDGTVSAAFETTDQPTAVLYRIGARALLDRFPGQRTVTLHIYASGRTIPRHNLTLDLDAVRAMLAAADKQQPGLANGNCRSGSSGIPDYLNIEDVTRCSFVSKEPQGEFAFGYGVSWLFDVSSRVRLAATAFSGDKEDPDAFLARMAHPFSRSAKLGLGVQVDGQPVERADRHSTLVGTAGSVRVTGADTDWAAVLDLERGGPLSLETRDAGGRLVTSVSLPAGLFAGVEARLAGLAPRWREMRALPMRYCTPEEPIVVT